MAEKAFDMEIGLGMAYDPSGAAAANADIEKIKRAAAGEPMAGGGYAAGARGAGGGQVDAREEEAMAKAREKSAEATGKASEASKELAKARMGGQKATTGAAKVEKELARERKGSADATTAAADAEKRAAAKASAAAQQKQQASAQNTEALSKEQQEIEALKAQMALEAKGRAGLIKELERLGKARARAAKAGDVQAYKQLEGQMARTRQAFERMNQGLEISRLGMMGQMQVAMGAMGAIQSLGNEVKSGEVSLMGMANATYALGAANKAGNGPMGWMLMAIQGLSMAWDWYANKQEEAAEAEKARMEAEQEALMAHWEEVQKYAAMDRENTLARWEKEFAGMRQGWEQFTQRELAAQRKADVEARAAEERRRIAAQAAYDAEVARVELAKTLGEISEAEVMQRKAAAEEEKAAELQAIDEAEARRSNVAHIEAKRRAEREAEELGKALEEKFGDFEEILRVEMPSNEEWEALQIKLNEGIGSMEERVQRGYIHDKIRELKQMLEAMGIAWQGSDGELIKWVNSMREAREAGEQRVRELQAIAQEESTAAQEVKLGNETRRAEAQAEAARREATRELEEARLQKQEEANRLAEEWQQKQRDTLEEQAEWLEEIAGSFEAGSKEAKKWEETLHKVRMQRVAEELQELENAYEEVGRYVEREGLTRAETYEVEEKALRERRAALERLKRTPGVDAGTLRAINQNLKRTEEETQQLKKNMRAAADTAQRDVEGMKPLGQKALNNTHQGNLKRLEKAYVKMARQAERQASRGDTRGMERTIAAMNRNALMQEKLTGYTGAAAERMRKVESALRVVARGTSAEERGMTAAQKRTRRVQAALRRQEKAAERAAKAEERAARAKGKETRKTERGGRKAEREPKKSPAKAQGQAAQASGEMTAMRTAVQQLEAENKKMQGELAKLAGAVVRCAEAAAGGAAAASRGADATQAAIGRLRGQIKVLEKKVDIIERKM